METNLIELRLITSSSMTNAIGKGKRRYEFAEWHVACPAAWHNYAKYDTYGMT